MQTQTKASCADLIRASIVRASGPNAKVVFGRVMDCRVKPGNDAENYCVFFPVASNCLR